MPDRLVLFDIDGTILLSGGAGRRAILAALADELGHSRDTDRVRFDGKTDPQIVVELLEAAGERGPHSTERIARVIERYVSWLEQDLAINAHRAVVMPGIHQLLDALAGEERVVLGLLTGNVVLGAGIKLRSVAIDPTRFRVGAYGSDHAERAELPAIAAERARTIFGRRPIREEIVIIGDTPADVHCGRGVGARSIGVATGSYSTGDLETAGAHFVFPDLSDTDRVRRTILS